MLLESVWAAIFILKESWIDWSAILGSVQFGDQQLWGHLPYQVHIN